MSDPTVEVRRLVSREVKPPPLPALPLLLFPSPFLPSSLSPPPPTLLAYACGLLSLSRGRRRGRVLNLPPGRCRPSNTRTSYRLPSNSRAADRPEIPAPIIRTRCLRGCGCWDWGWGCAFCDDAAVCDDFWADFWADFCFWGARADADADADLDGER